MTAAEFVRSVIGKPYRLGESGDAYDCYTLLQASFGRINGITLPAIGERSGFNVEAPSAVAMPHYKACERRDGAIAACYDKDGNMVHVGRVLCGGILHANGGATKLNGSVMLSDIQQFERLYRLSGGHVKYLELLDGNH